MPVLGARSVTDRDNVPKLALVFTERRGLLFFYIKFQVITVCFWKGFDGAIYTWDFNKYSETNPEFNKVIEMIVLEKNISNRFFEIIFSGLFSKKGVEGFKSTHE